MQEKLTKQTTNEINILFGRNKLFKQKLISIIANSISSQKDCSSNT